MLRVSSLPMTLSIFLILKLANSVSLPFFMVTERISSFLWGPKDLKKSKMVCRHGSNDQPTMSRSKSDDPSLSREDMEIVLRSLGFLRGLEDEKLPEKLDANIMSNMFDEETPVMDEFKEAFDTFDKNRDGFIDAEELQEILCKLGFREEVEIDNCKRMIRVFDENDDGRIDLDEFLKLMDQN